MKTPQLLLISFLVKVGLPPTTRTDLANGWAAGLFVSFVIENQKQIYRSQKKKKKTKNYSFCP
jgi:hypothetical protein